MGKTRDGFGFDLKPAGAGGDQNPGVDGFDYPGTRMFDMSPVSIASQYL